MTATGTATKASESTDKRLNPREVETASPSQGLTQDVDSEGCGDGGVRTLCPHRVFPGLKARHGGKEQLSARVPRAPRQPLAAHPPAVSADDEGVSAGEEGEGGRWTNSDAQERDRDEGTEGEREHSSASIRKKRESKQNKGTHTD